jgi:hypothetical protein
MVRLIKQSTSAAVDISIHLINFRIASRELFNNHFRIADPWENTDVAWPLEIRFSEVEEVLFQKLVTEAAALAPVRYTELQSSIQVELNGATDSVPIMLNREIKSGYWDYPIKKVTRDAHLWFLEFFDWDSLSYHDNQYVRVHVQDWPSHPETNGKQGLIQARYVRFTKLTETADIPIKPVGRRRYRSPGRK